MSLRIWIPKNQFIVEDGQIICSTVTSIERGSDGDPGEKFATIFTRIVKLSAILQVNSAFGIFGKLYRAS